MGRKKKHPEHENLERWLVSYADFITLLFATFTALFAMTLSDLTKFTSNAEAIQEGFRQQNIISGIKSIMHGQSAPQDNPNPIASQKGAGPGVIGKYDSLTYSPGEVKKVDEAVEELQKIAEEVNAEQRKPITEKPPPDKTGKKTAEEADLTKGGGIGIALQERGVKVSFDSRLLFQPGTATLKPESRKLLAQIAQRLKPFSGTNLIQIEGHTDSQPIASALYPSNWELSTGRASTVVRELVNQYDFQPSHLAAVGYGDTRPVATNATVTGRAANRRIDIVIYSKIDSKKIDPESQAKKEQPLVKPRFTKPRLEDQLIYSGEAPADDGPVKVIYVKKDGTHSVETVVPKKGRVVEPVDPFKDVKKKP